jgi:hypothetical protein
LTKIRLFYNLGFMGKSGFLAAFSRAFHKTNRVLENAQVSITFGT